MLKWKRESQGRSVLMIEGARRVGKSFIVREFASREYESYILIDFNNTTEQVRGLFQNYLNDLDSFFMYLSLSADVTLHERKSLIILAQSHFLCDRGFMSYSILLISIILRKKYSSSG